MNMYREGKPGLEGEIEMGENVVAGPFNDGWRGVYFLVTEEDGTEQVRYQEEDVTLKTCLGCTAVLWASDPDVCAACDEQGVTA